MAKPRPGTLQRNDFRKKPIGCTRLPEQATVVSIADSYPSYQLHVGLTRCTATSNSDRTTSILFHQPPISIACPTIGLPHSGPRLDPRL